jgi:hypothetical protein
MEGKKIEKVLELGDQVVLLKMDDGTYVSARIIDPEIPEDVVNEFLGEAPQETRKEKTEKAPLSKGKTSKEETTDDDEINWEALKGMNRKALKKVIEDKDLLTDADDFGDDDSLREAIADELDIAIPKEKGKEDAGEPDNDGSDYTWKDLKAMDYDELKTLCEENKADTDPDDFDTDSEDKFRRAIAKEFQIKIPTK